MVSKVVEYEVDLLLTYLFIYYEILLLNFGRPAPPGRGSAAGRKFLARSVCVSLSAFFIMLIVFFAGCLHVACLLREWNCSRQLITPGSSALLLPLLLASA